MAALYPTGRPISYTTRWDTILNRRTQKALQSGTTAFEDFGLAHLVSS